MTFTVAINGRPNVGKSTMFKRLAGSRLAIVNDHQGFTRDRREGRGKIADLRFTVIDTAGLEEAAEGLEARMREQTERALDDADVALMLIDARAGITPLDHHFADWLRRRGTPSILVANKCESTGGGDGVLEAYGLGLGDPIPLSAEHGEGLGDLYDALVPFAEAAEENSEDSDADAETGPLQLAIVGRPNVGKSTLVNHLLGEERMLTGPEAGVTRDAIATEWMVDGRAIRLVDTAGIRRKARITETVEGLAAGDALRAIRFAQVVVLMIDAETGLEKQDLAIARMTAEEGRAMVLAPNKWDLIANAEAARRRISDRLQTSLPQVRGIPVVPLSALTGRGVDKLLPAALTAFDLWNQRIPTGRLNAWLKEVTERHPPPMAQGRRIRLRYITQAKTRPPTFIVFVSRTKGLPDSYVNYLTNRLRQDFDLPGIPLRLHLRKGENPYVKE